MMDTGTGAPNEARGRWSRRASMGGCGLVAWVGAIGCDPAVGARGGAASGIDIEDSGDAGTSDGQGQDAGAASGGSDGGSDGAGDTPQPGMEDPTPELPFDPGALGDVCARNNGDRVAQALCSGAQLHSIADLRNALEFASPFFSLTSNSSSLVARDVSAINPRLIIGDRLSPFGDAVPGAEDPNLLAMGFARGEQFVELVGFDPVANDLNFYLLMFEQDCNASDAGCSTADLVTPAVEEDWTRWTLYQDVDLVNTTVDCAVCHQPLGPGTPKIPRLQEISNSWTHWFPVRPPQPGGVWSSGGASTRGIVPEDPEHGTRSSEVAWSMFERMHGVDGAYGGVSLDLLRLSTAGPELETFVRTFMMGRDLPEALTVPEFEGTQNSDYFCDSAAMEILGEDAAWQQAFARVVDGSRLPLPSPRVDITDAASREAAIQSYVDVLAGVAAPETLLDPRQVVAPEVLTQMSVLPTADATAPQILSHMCGRCHNDRLDPALSRARFDATSLAGLTVAAKQVIADRIVRGHDDKYLMPPPRFGTLPDWAIDRVLVWLDP